MITNRFYIFSILVVLCTSHLFSMQREESADLPLSKFAQGKLYRAERSARFLPHFDNFDLYMGRNADCGYNKYVFSVPRSAQKLYIIKITSGLLEGRFLSTLADADSDSALLDSASEENMKLIQMCDGRS